jgi:hypothetical protein
MAEKSAELTLERVRTRFVDRFRKYVVEVDGRQVAEIEGGRVQTFELEPGRHRVRLTLDEAVESETLSFSVASGESKHLICRPKRKDTSDWLWIFNFSSTIDLREVE